MQQLRRSNRWWLAGLAALASLGLLLAALGWQLRPEALRERLESTLQVQWGRPVRIGQLGFVWLRGESGQGNPATSPQLQVTLSSIELPPLANRRGLQVKRADFFVLAAPAAWWRAWREAAPWPVTAIELHKVSTAPVAAPHDDGFGDWRFQSIRLDGLTADPTQPRVDSVRLNGVWHRRGRDAGQLAASKLSAFDVPVAGALHDVAISLPKETAPGLSLARAELALGGLDFLFERLVASSSTATFAVQLAPVNLRQALPPLGIPLPATADAKAFTRVAVQAECHRDEAGLGCGPLAMQVDDTRLDGSAGQPWRAAAVNATPAPWRLEFAADRLDLDRYLPPDNPAEPPLDIPWTQADAWPLAVELTVEQLRIGGVRFRGATLSLRAGERGLETR